MHSTAALEMGRSKKRLNCSTQLAINQSLMKVLTQSNSRHKRGGTTSSSTSMHPKRRIVLAKSMDDLGKNVWKSILALKSM